MALDPRALAVRAEHVGVEQQVHRVVAEHQVLREHLAQTRDVRRHAAVLAGDGVAARLPVARTPGRPAGLRLPGVVLVAAVAAQDVEAQVADRRLAHHELGPPGGIAGPVGPQPSRVIRDDPLRSRLGKRKERAILPLVVARIGEAPVRAEKGIVRDRRPKALERNLVRADAEKPREIIADVKVARQRHAAREVLRGATVHGHLADFRNPSVPVAAGEVQVARLAEVAREIERARQREAVLLGGVGEQDRISRIDRPRRIRPVVQRPRAAQVDRDARLPADDLAHRDDVLVADKARQAGRLARPLLDRAEMSDEMVVPRVVTGARLVVVVNQVRDLRHRPVAAVRGILEIVKARRPDRAVLPRRVRKRDLVPEPGGILRVRHERIVEIADAKPLRVRGDRVAERVVPDAGRNPGGSAVIGPEEAEALPCAPFDARDEVRGEMAPAALPHDDRTVVEAVEPERIGVRHGGREAVRQRRRALPREDRRRAAATMPDGEEPRVVAEAQNVRQELGSRHPRLFGRLAVQKRRDRAVRRGQGLGRDLAEQPQVSLDRLPGGRHGDRQRKTE